MCNDDAEKSIGTASESIDNATKSPTVCGKNPKNPKSPTVKPNGVSAEMVNVESGLATFSDKMKGLTKPIKDCLALYAKPKKKALMAQYVRLQDMALLTIISVLSGALPNYRFFYRGSKYFSCLMTIVVAIAGAGKSIMEPIFELISTIHQEFRDKYKTQMQTYQEQQRKMKTMSKSELKGFLEEVMEKPAQQFYRIPADATYAAFMKALSVMDGMGEILETEIDCMLNAFKSELGDYSVFIRKNFKHESHNYTRKTDNEYVEIMNPRFTIVLSGTLSQMVKFVSEVLSGMFSRFNIYWNKTKPEWVDETYYDDEPMDEKMFYHEMGVNVARLYHVLERRTSGVRFKLTKGQLKKFNNNFGKLHLNYTSLDGDDMSASIFRLGVVFHRIAMVLSISRLLYMNESEMEEALKEDVVCKDVDFDNAMTIVLCLMEHASAYFEHITGMDDDVKEDLSFDGYNLGNNRLAEVVKDLPNNCRITRQQIIDVFVAHDIPTSTASKNIRKLCKIYILEKVEHGVYVKSTPQAYLMKTEEAKKAKKAQKSKKK